MSTHANQPKTIKAFLICLLLITSLLGGCATTGSHHAGSGEAAAEQQEVNIDPFENANRAIYKFNTGLDRVILRPVAKGYQKVVPSPVRKGVSNFFSNLLEPSTAVNSLLQGKPKQAGQSLGRFLVNTSLGFFGVLDVATPMNIPKYREDFGQTFAVWGVESGPYLMLPFLGPSNLRDFGGLLTHSAFTDVTTGLSAENATYATALRLMNTRSQLLSFDETLNLQVDPYAFIRDGYKQRRLEAIYDGNVPQAEEDDEFEAELFDD